MCYRFPAQAVRRAEDRSKRVVACPALPVHHTTYLNLEPDVKLADRPPTSAPMHALCWTVRDAAFWRWSVGFVAGNLDALSQGRPLKGVVRNASHAAQQHDHL
jgi:hypothetical protein